MHMSFDACYSSLWEETYFASPTKSNTILRPQREEGKILASPVTAQPMGGCHRPANKKSVFFELSDWGLP